MMRSFSFGLCWGDLDVLLVSFERDDPLPCLGPALKAAGAPSNLPFFFAEGVLDVPPAYAWEARSSFLLFIDSAFTPRFIS